MSRSFLYDTWAFIALVDSRDPGHGLAVELDHELERNGFSPITTDYIVGETLTFVHASVGARGSLAFLDVLEDRLDASDIRLVEIGAARRARALEIFLRLAPAEPKLSFTDATSFAVMAELGVEHAFTADRHFHRAGNGIAPLVERKGARLIARSVRGT